MFIPRKMEFKGWVADHSEGSFQGITDDAVAKLLNDFERLVPQHTQKWFDWDQTRNKGFGQRRLWHVVQT